MASVKTRIGNVDSSNDIRASLDCRRSASLQTPFFALSIFPRVQEPAAIRPYGLRVFQTHCWAVSYEQWDMNFVKSYELVQNILLYFCQKRICVPSKFFTKPYFCINPAGKSKVPSWKIFISQLENYFFSVGKSKFRSRAFWDTVLGSFLNYFIWFLFILAPIRDFRKKVKMFDIERWAVSCEKWVVSNERWANIAWYIHVADSCLYVFVHRSSLNADKYVLICQKRKRKSLFVGCDYQFLTFL